MLLMYRRLLGVKPVQINVFLCDVLIFYSVYSISLFCKCVIHCYLEFFKEHITRKIRYNKKM